MVTPATDPVLIRYLALDEDLTALAAETGQSLPALLDWLHSPEIARTVARFRAHQEHQLAKRALASLAAIVSSSPDPTEQRRAATTILRTVKGPAAPRPRLKPPAPDFGDDLDDDLDTDREDDEHADFDEPAPTPRDRSTEGERNRARVQGPQPLVPLPTPRSGPDDRGSFALPRSSHASEPPRQSLPSGGTRGDDEAEQMRAHDNRHANYDLPPIPPYTGPPRV